MIMTMSSAFKALAAVALVGVLSACGATQARDDYYQSVAAAAQAQAAQSEARYRALATVANSGDPGAATAATMAIALTATPTITPQYIESEALSWGKTLAMPVATLGGLFIQADVAKNASNNAKDVQLASYASNEAIQLGQQNMVTSLGSQWAEGAGASAAALSDLGVAGFTALNTAGDQTVALGTVGFETVDSVATTGFTTVDSVATSGFDAVTTTSVAGMVGIESVATTGMADLVTMGVAGMDSTLTMGTIGIDGLGAMSVDYNTLLGDINTSNNALVGDISTDYQAVISELNAIIESLGSAGGGS